ncbi:MAG: acyltransferase [Elusimicrobia bacterium]|nr:acyltransferase [Elusimicrobiota bacterium]
MEDITKAPQNRLAALDGLRGYAAIAVVIYHAILFPIAARASDLLAMRAWSLKGYDFWARLILAGVSGETAVILFFAMRGAVLLRSLDSETRRSGTFRTLALFAPRRAFRIYPALIGCLVGLYVIYEGIFLMFPSIYPTPNLNATIINATLYDTSAHGATWTLKAEIQSIPLILIAFILRKTLGTFGLTLLLIYSVLLLESSYISFGIQLVSGCLMYFVAGFIAYDLSKSTLIQDLMRGWRWVSVLAIIIFLRAFFSLSSNVAKLLQLAGVVVFISYLLSGQTSSLTRFLSWRISVFFGKISYSLYLWNVIFLNILLIPAVRYGWTKTHYIESGLIIGIGATIISIPFSMLSEKCLERPFSSMWKSPKRVSLGAP